LVREDAMTDNLDAAKKLIEDELLKRVERCQSKIQQALKEENCFLDAVMIVSQRGVFPQINIKPNLEK
jgi:hypothetical protein